MDELAEIDLQKSFVLNWEVTERDFEIEVDMCICESHPRYVRPNEGEIGCYVKSKFLFINVDSISGLKAKSEVQSTLDPDGTRDYGEIEAFAINTRGQFGISGEFGDLIISCEKLIINYATNA